MATWPRVPGRPHTHTRTHTSYRMKGPYVTERPANVVKNKLNKQMNKIDVLLFLRRYCIQVKKKCLIYLF